MKVLLESYRITCFIYRALAVKINLTEASLQALRSWCLCPLGREFPTKAAAELYKGRCPVHTLGCKRQYQSWAHKISCSVPSCAGLGWGRVNFLHSKPWYSPSFWTQNLWWRNISQSKTSNIGARERECRWNERENNTCWGFGNMFKRKAWNTKLEGKSVEIEGTGEKWSLGISRTDKRADGKTEILSNNTTPISQFLN